jgi:hypothetical protein
VDTWGNYRLFLVVTDDTPEVSEADPVEAPSSAFVVVRVTGQYEPIQRLAPGERDYELVTNAWAEKINALRNDHDSQTIADHDTSATGAQLDELVGGGATALHSHGAGGIAVATELATGTVLLAEAPQNPAAPKVSTQDRFKLCAQVAGTMATTGFQPGVVDVPGAGNWSKACAAWLIDEACYLDSIDCTIFDGGSAAGVYQLGVYEQTTGEFATGTLAVGLLATFNLNSHTTVDHAAASASAALAAIIPAGRVILVAVLSSTHAIKGGGLGLKINGRKQW